MQQLLNRQATAAISNNTVSNDSGVNDSGVRR